jgi:hypothetical protein
MPFDAEGWSVVQASTIMSVAPPVAKFATSAPAA